MRLMWQLTARWPPAQDSAESVPQVISIAEPLDQSPPPISTASGTADRKHPTPIAAATVQVQPSRPLPAAFVAAPAGTVPRTGSGTRPWLTARGTPVLPPLLPGCAPKMLSATQSALAFQGVPAPY